MKFLKALLLTALVCLASRASASTFYGLPDDVLTVGVGARAISLGGAFAAVSDDATAPYYNPAGLAQQKAYNAQFMYAPLQYDTSLNYFGVVLPAAPWLTFGFGGVLLGSGGFEQRDASNNVLGTASVSNNVYMFSAGTKIDRFLFGITTKMITENIVGYSGSALGVDLGMMTDLYPWLRVAATLQNINRPSIQLLNTPDTYPIRLNIAGRVLLPGEIFSIVAQAGTDFQSDYNYQMGGELTLGKNFAIRAGIDNQLDPVFGFGVNYQNFTVDYAFSNQTGYGNLNRFSFSYKFGDLFRTKVTPKFESGETTVVLRATENTLPFKTEMPKYPVGWWKLIIMSGDKSVVRQLGAMGPPPETIDWDLKDTFGRPVRAGKYTYEYHVYYKSDYTWVDSGEITVTEPGAETPVQMNIKIIGQ